MISSTRVFVFVVATMTVSSLSTAYVLEKKYDQALRLKEATSIQIPIELKAACEADQRGCVVAPADQFEEVVNNVTEKAFNEGKIECNKSS
jgi:hypothetical protein